MKVSKILAVAALAVLAIVVFAFRTRGEKVESEPKLEEKTINIYNAETDRVEEVKTVVKTDAEWKKILTPEQYKVMRNKGTEKPFSGACEVDSRKESGIYECVGCGTDLFKYDTKFESGTGWPSFYEPVSELNVVYKPDISFSMRRTEVLCARCGAHLGHMFEDGPPPTWHRFCINSVAIRFVEPKKTK